MPGLGKDIRSALVLINKIASVASDVDLLIANAKSSRVRGSLYMAKSILSEGRQSIIRAATKQHPWARGVLGAQLRSKNGPNCGTGAGGFKQGNDCASGGRRGSGGGRPGRSNSGSSGSSGRKGSGSRSSGFTGSSEASWANEARPELIAAMKSSFGDDYAKSMVSVAGIPDGSIVKMVAKTKSSVLFEATHADKGIKMTRGFAFQRGKVYLNGMTNMGFEVTAKNRGKGLYAESLLAQAESMSAKGMSRIFADGIRSDGDNSYYTMARLGFDAEIVDMMFLSQETYDKIGKQFPQAERLSDIVKTAKGRKFWKENGGPYHAEFDTSAGSKSIKRLRAYVTAKRRSQAGNGG